MSQDVWSVVDDYICTTLIAPDEVLSAALRASEAAELPNHNVAPNQGKFLYLLAKMKDARRILEIGALGGYSTLWLARALASGTSSTSDWAPRWIASRSYVKLARSGTVIIGDNVVRDGAVAESSSGDPNVIGIRGFLNMMGNHPRLEATALQTVGSKGYDGFSWR